MGRTKKQVKCANESCDNLIIYTNKSFICRSCYDSQRKYNSILYQENKLLIEENTIYSRICSNGSCGKLIQYKNKKSYQRAIRKINLNVTDGLCRTCIQYQNYINHPDIKIKLSEYRKQNTGWKHTDTTKQKMSDSAKKTNCNKGRIYSDLEKIILSEKNKKYWKSLDLNTKQVHGQRVAASLKLYHENKRNNLDSNEIDDKKNYYKNVRRITKNQPLNTIPNYDLRGIAKNGCNTFHLDHLISKKFGYENNIPEYIIGHFCNLNYISWKHNLVKSDKCAITLDELLENITLYDFRPFV